MGCSFSTLKIAKFFKTMGGSSSTERENKNISRHRQNTSPPQPPQFILKISNYVTVHKDTIKLEVDKCNPDKHLVSFTFDALYDGSVTIFYYGKEEADCTFTPLYPSDKPVQVSFSKGADQKFLQPPGTGFDLRFFGVDSLWEGLVKPFARDSVFPLVIMAESCEKPLPQPLSPTAGEASNVQQPPPPPTAGEASNVQQPPPPPTAGEASNVQQHLPPPTVGEASNEQLQSLIPATTEQVPDEQLEQKLLPPITPTQVTQAVIKEIDEGQFQVNVIKQTLWFDGHRYDLNDNECCICRTNAQDTAFKPCAHLSCSACAVQVTNCPFCREPIEERIA